MQRTALWKSLRPQRIEDFVGNEHDLSQLIGLQEGAILFYGPIGCGKTSAALALACAVIGKPVPILGENFSEEGDLAWYRQGSDFQDDWLIHRPMFGRQLLILDEAQELTARQQTKIQVHIESHNSSLLCLCTSEPIKIQEALQSRCTNKVQLGPLGGEERKTLAMRGWTARGMEGEPPAALFAEWDSPRGETATAPRTILNTIDLICDGAMPRDAVRRTRRVASNG